MHGCTKGVQDQTFLKMLKPRPGIEDYAVRGHLASIQDAGLTKTVERPTMPELTSNGARQALRKSQSRTQNARNRGD